MRSPAMVSLLDTIVSSVLTIETTGESFVDISGDVAAFLTEAEIATGQVTLFVRHTSASLTIQENADPDVLRDLKASLRMLAPENAGWRHDAEGPDDMPAHIRTMLTATSLQIPVLNARLMLGTWQGIYLIEHRARPHRREVVLQAVGTTG